MRRRVKMSNMLRFTEEDLENYQLRMRKLTTEALCKPREAVITDAPIPDYATDNDQPLSKVKKTLKIVLPFKLPTWNLLLGVNRWQRAKIRHWLHDDPDGISIKAVLDGIVHSGILPDDNSDIIEEVRFTQEKSDTEETEITITWREV
jgi:hypothetical protein